MRLLVPSWQDLNGADARLVRITEILGGKVEILPLENGTALSEAFFEGRVAEKNCCVVVNPEVLGKCFPRGEFPSELASYLTSGFPHLLVYNVRPDLFSSSVIRALSGERLQSVSAREVGEAKYVATLGRDDTGGRFSGLSFSRGVTANDQVFCKGPGSDALQTLITLDNQPVLASLRGKRAQVFFMATECLADLDAAWDGKLLVPYFSGLIPPAMAVRRIFGDQCWMPDQRHATLIIDDPLLRKDYGFLNYEDALKSMNAHNFHMSVAFIPHNFRRNSPAITRLFRQRPDRYSICFHGNDHTGAEFAAKDVNLLNSMLRVAETRMDAHHKAAALECDKVMVFPQGNFSTAAMRALRANNFYAAVNTGALPRGEMATLSLADGLQPAVLRYGGFPLFLRKYVRKITPQDVALDLFFGRPLFLVEHHNIFKDPSALEELADSINISVPEIRWSSLRTAIENSWLRRRGEDGKIEVKLYSKVSQVSNTSTTRQEYAVQWPERGARDIEKIDLDGVPYDYVWGADGTARLQITLAPGESRLVSVLHDNKFGVSDLNTRLGWTAKAFVRRRLSEIRDNHLSRNPRILSAAKYIQKRLLSGAATHSERAD